MQTMRADMGVNLHGCDASMTQQQLQTTQIGAVIQQMGGQTVPQHMG
jgi:hypothetical protein